jgi:glycerol kinase
VILAIDQGTTSTTCLVVDDELRVRGRGYRGLRQHFPQPGWVEHDPEEIRATAVGAAGDALRRRAATRSGRLRSRLQTCSMPSRAAWPCCADGGASANEFRCSSKPICSATRSKSPPNRETTALGAAALAGLAAGVWPNLAAIRAGIRHRGDVRPSADQASLTERRADWRAAVRRALLN